MKKYGMSPAAPPSPAACFGRTAQPMPFGRHARARPAACFGRSAQTGRTALPMPFGRHAFARPLRQPGRLLQPLRPDWPHRPVDVLPADTLSLDAQRSGTRLGSTSPSAGAALRSAGRHR